MRSTRSREILNIYYTAEDRGYSLGYNIVQILNDMIKVNFKNVVDLNLQNVYRNCLMDTFIRRKNSRWLTTVCLYNKHCYFNINIALL